MQRLSKEMNRIRVLVLVNVLATVAVIALSETSDPNASTNAILYCTISVVVASSIMLFLINRARNGYRDRVSVLKRENRELNSAQRQLTCSIEDKSRENEYLTHASARFEDLFHGVPFGCFTVDDLGKIFEWNTTASELFDLPSHIAIQRTVFEGLFDEKSTNQLATALKHALGGDSIKNLELHTASGSTSKHLLVNIFGIGSNSSHMAAMIACADITKLKLAEVTILEQNELLNNAMLKVNEDSVTLEIQRLELVEKNDALNRLATTDGITGLLNHRAMQTELASAIDHSQNSGTSVGVLLLDVDYFKKFNDDFGHQVGDEVLKGIAKILVSSVREADIVARYGGEEFCVILPSADAYECKLICENIRHNVESAPWCHRTVTISVGFELGDGTSLPSDLIKCADTALYQAKGQGRNRVCMFESKIDRCA